MTITPNNNAGYGYGYDSNFGYGYGYTGGKLEYKIILDTTGYSSGVYDVEFIANIKDTEYSKTGTLTINRVGGGSGGNTAGVSLTINQNNLSLSAGNENFTGTNLNADNSNGNTEPGQKTVINPQDAAGNSGITGAVLGGILDNGKLIIAIIFVIAILSVGVIFGIRRNARRLKIKEQQQTIDYYSSQINSQINN
jgi:hypothetical protein